MKLNFASFFLLLLLSLAVPSPAAAQQQQPLPDPNPNREAFSAVNGMVRYAASGERAANATVEIRGQGGQRMGMTLTDTRGVFAFTRLGHGMYTLIIQKYGYEEITYRFDIRADLRGVPQEGPQGLVFYLKGTEDPNAPAGPTVSVRELSISKKAQDAFEKGREFLLTRKDPKGSISHLERTVKEAPDFYEAYYLLGMARAQSGDPAAAEAAYQKAIELSEDGYAPVRVAQAALWCDQQKFDDAEKSARRGLEIDPNDWQGHYHLARALFGLNRVDDSEQSLKEAMSRKAEFADFHLLLANIHIRRKEYPAVVQNLDDYLRMAPSGPRAEQIRQLRANVQRQMAGEQTTSAPKP